MDAKEYKELSFKINHGEPAREWQMFYHTVIKELEDYPKMRHAKKTYNLWKKDFNECYHILPRDVDRIMNWYYSDFGVWGVVITENYKCGFFCRYHKEDAGIYLDYENKNGEQVYETCDNFGILCDKADSLVGDDTDLFKILGQAFSKIADAVKYFEEHITFEYIDKDNKHFTICKEDDKVINYYQWHSSDLGWKI